MRLLLLLGRAAPRTAPFVGMVPTGWEAQGEVLLPLRCACLFCLMLTERGA